MERVESWLKNQHSHAISWIQNQSKRINNKNQNWNFNMNLSFKVSFPWEADMQSKRKLKEEFRKRKYQFQIFVNAVKAQNIADLQDILCSMALSESVYKWPASEVVRFLNKFKADFGGQLISLERVQISLDHVLHRYLLAEGENSLFVCFIGTKQYKDIVADANILQGTVFNEDTKPCSTLCDNENIAPCFHLTDSKQNAINSAKKDVHKNGSMPAVHKGFLARAKGIPALELYRLAQKRNKKLVLCGHSLGGAVAVLVTLSILRAFASSVSTADSNKVTVKCITFSQPPVGNAALRDYVYKNGWQQHFRTYCIPEDLVPRILSPSYFHHYRAQSNKSNPDRIFLRETRSKKSSSPEETGQLKSNIHDSDQLVFRLGSIQASLQRLSKAAILARFGKRPNGTELMKNKTCEDLAGNPVAENDLDREDVSSEISQMKDCINEIAATEFPEKNKVSVGIDKNEKTVPSRDLRRQRGNHWQKMPSLPSYVPFGELFLLGKESAEPLSASEFTKLTTVHSVFSELRERFQSHSMRSYRSRFQKIYDLCIGNNCSSVMGLDPLPKLPHLKQWLDLAVAGAIELGSIAEPMELETAVSLVPLGWNGITGKKNSRPLTVDLYGYGLHQCNLVHAQLNGRWCSTVVESIPQSAAFLNLKAEKELQRMCIEIGAPLKQGPKDQVISTSTVTGSEGEEESDFSDATAKSVFNLPGITFQGNRCEADGLSDIIVHCSSDFMTVSKKVYVKLRRVQLVGAEGSGKTSLFNALMAQGKGNSYIHYDGVLPEIKYQEGISGGVCFIDPLTTRVEDLLEDIIPDSSSSSLSQSKNKVDLVLHVHNLAQKTSSGEEDHISKYYSSLSSCIDKIGALGIPSVLAITNKFSKKDFQQSSQNIMEVYNMPPGKTTLVNSIPYFPQTVENEFCAWNIFRVSGDSECGRLLRGFQNLLQIPKKFQIPFRNKEIYLPPEGLEDLQKLVHKELLIREESTFQELAKNRLLVEAIKEKEQTSNYLSKPNSTLSAFFGASLGAGVGIIVAVVMGAASVFRKPWMLFCKILGFFEGVIYWNYIKPF